MLNELFGNETSAKILLYLENYNEGTASGISRTFAMNKTRVYKQLLRLEEAGILVARSTENLRQFSFNPRLLFRDDLKKLLRSCLSRMDREEFNRYYAERRRPRRTGKTL